MTAEEIHDAIRKKYNAVGDNHWSDAEIYDLIYQYCQELAVDYRMIEGSDTSTSTASGTRAYNFPTRLIEAKKVYYDGKRLTKIGFVHDDLITGMDEDTTDTGTPVYYTEWNDQLLLRPIPDAIKTLKIHGYFEQERVASGVTISIPTAFHMCLVDPVTSDMFAKEGNGALASYHLSKWENNKKRAQRWMKIQKRADKFTRVKTEEEMSKTILGAL